jgi:hypothetical protein
MCSRALVPGTGLESAPLATLDSKSGAFLFLVHPRECCSSLRREKRNIGAVQSGLADSTIEIDQKSKMTRVARA